MSLIKCDFCKNIVDTNEEHESFEVIGYPHKCICAQCIMEIDEDNFGGDMYDSDRKEHSTYWGLK